MKTFDASEMQVRINECGEGEYVRREVADKLYEALVDLLLDFDTREAARQALVYADMDSYT